MKKYLIPFSVIFAVLSFNLLTRAQFTPEELAKRPKWEEFLRTAKIIKSEQPWDFREAVTRPWRLTLEKDGIVINALWKDAKGRMHGVIENWYWEIAAYRLDKCLGVNMVPPTVEKKFDNKTGSCQMYAGVMDLEEKVENKVKTPSYRIFHLNRAYYIQRAFDNLIANNDRHQN